MKLSFLLGVWCGILVGLTSCGGSEKPPRPARWWSPEVEPPQAKFFENRPWLLDLSSWSSPGCGHLQPQEARYLGDFGTGNGHAFVLSGYTCPLNSLHTMAGPDYQQESAFFKDTWLELWTASGQAPLEVVDGQMFRVRRSAILISRERTDDLELYTVTFAPLGAGAADPVNRAIVRAVVVKNTSAGALSGLRLRATEGTTGNGLDRHRTLVALDPDSVQDPAEVPLADIAPGGERVVRLAYVTHITPEQEAETTAALRATGFDDLLEATRDGWRAFLGQAARLESPDPRVDDLLESALVTVRTQQIHLGGVSPMSRYSLMWIRDTAGVVRFLARCGLFAQVRAMLDYYHTASILRGDISNAVALDYAPDTPPPEPDWASMPPFQGRQAGEVTSYLPLMTDWYARASGDTDLVASQYEFLKRAVLAQNVSADWLIPFSGDETYRGAMSAALGLDIEHDYPGCCKSANSSFLFVAAAEALAGHAERLGHAQDAQELQQLSAAVRQAAEDTFFTDPGFYAPFIDLGDPENLPAPFEDVSTQPLWTGYAGVDDQRARANLENVIALLGRPDGFLQSPIDARYRGQPLYFDIVIDEGVHTGMMPGYFLYNLAAADHPMAESAFNALALAASPSGNFSEYHIYDDHSVLQFFYDTSGVLGDLTARFRPWEGAICLDALVYYLTGWEPDAPAGAVALAPRLPNRWPSMSWTGLAVGSMRFDLLVEELGGRRRVTVTPTVAGSLMINLSIPLPPVTVEKVQVGGDELAPTEYTLWSPFGQTRVRLEPVRVDRSNPLVVTVDYDG